MLDDLDTIQREGLAELQAAGDADALEAWRIAYIGPKGKLRALMPRMKEVPREQKAAVGQRLNEVKGALESAFEEHKGATGAGAEAATPAVDMTEPGLIDTRHLGRRHIVSRVRAELVEVFARMGFDVAQGPELEDDEHNFVKLNIPPAHPARDPIDNFYVDDPKEVDGPRMLRSQTSTVQIRTMERIVAEGSGPPIKIVSPGRVYRPDTVDATHSFMFHQIEGLYIDRGVTMADLKTTLLQFARAYFGEDAQIRLRPSFFPFTEPSAEFDMMIALKPGEPPRWIELGGCGMVDPNVLQACGVDPEEWTGFAFGFGIERIAMGKYAIPDIRMLFENDVRFLERV
ncbi:MAG: phenylalanine--tRNA ligase subunit alpha [Phycisphaerales bacterium]|nr:phenylalanine--tRNA ligase subunit alpha [Planctomycetota bacterium]MCH8508709.1 phenylalanine--tRNA ligase subunit alpha [Phycisphaerales bacterium]